MVKSKKSDKNGDHVDNFKNISKLGNNTNANNFVGGKFYSSPNRTNYIIFKDDYTLISNEWGEQKYQIVEDEALIGYDPDSGKHLFLKASFNNNDNISITVTSIDEYSREENGRYKEYFVRLPK